MQKLWTPSAHKWSPLRSQAACLIIALGVAAFTVIFGCARGPSEGQAGQPAVPSDLPNASLDPELAHLSDGSFLAATVRHFAPGNSCNQDQAKAMISAVKEAIQIHVEQYSKTVKPTRDARMPRIIVHLAILKENRPPKPVGIADPVRMLVYQHLYSWCASRADRISGLYSRVEVSSAISKASRTEQLVKTCDVASLPNGKFLMRALFISKQDRHLEGDVLVKDVTSTLRNGLRQYSITILKKSPDQQEAALDLWEKAIHQPIALQMYKPLKNGSLVMSEDVRRRLNSSVYQQLVLGYVVLAKEAAMNAPALVPDSELDLLERRCSAKAAAGDVEASLNIRAKATAWGCRAAIDAALSEWQRNGYTRSIPMVPVADVPGDSSRANEIIIEYEIAFLRQLNLRIKEAKYGSNALAPFDQSRLRLHARYVAISAFGIQPER